MENLGPSGRSCRREDLVGSVYRVGLGVRDAELGVPQRSACRTGGDLGGLRVRTSPPGTGPQGLDELGVLASLSHSIGTCLK